MKEGALFSTSWAFECRQSELREGTLSKHQPKFVSSLLRGVGIRTGAELEFTGGHGTQCKELLPAGGDSVQGT